MATVVVVVEEVSPEEELAGLVLFKDKDMLGPAGRAANGSSRVRN